MRLESFPRKFFYLKFCVLFKDQLGNDPVIAVFLIVTVTRTNPVQPAYFYFELIIKKTNRLDKSSSLLDSTVADAPERMDVDGA